MLSLVCAAVELMWERDELLPREIGQKEQRIMLRIRKKGWLFSFALSSLLFLTLHADELGFFG